MKTFKEIIKRGYLLGLITAITASSCTKDILKTVSPTSIAYENAFDTPERILAQVNRLYAQAKDGNFLGGRGIVLEELRSNEFIVNQPNPITGLEIWTQGANSSTSHINTIWSAAYTTINSCNLLIEGIEVNKSKIDPLLATQYTAEAKFVRALCYTYLIQSYAIPYSADKGASLGLPLRLKGETSGANSNLARSSVAQIYDQIISDLNDAETGLPLNYATPLLNTTRAHKNTAIALKTRIFLIKEEYDNVITEASKIVSATAPYQASSGVNNKLEANIATVFGGTYTGPEAMFSLPMTLADGLVIQRSLSYYFSAPPGNTEYYLNPAGILANPAFSTPNDARYGLTTVYNNNRWLEKFKAPAPYAEYVPIIRYSEVLLNYAEASARKGNLSKATELLTAVKTRSNPRYVFSQAEVGSETSLISTILIERRMELLGEGFSAFDLLRNLQPLPAKSGAQGVAPSVQPLAPNYIWPMPGDESSTNNLLQPNP